MTARATNPYLWYTKKEHEIFRNADLDTSISIDRGPCEVSIRKSNRAIGRVVDRIETLEERLAVYEIEVCTAHGIDIINNEIDTVGRSSLSSVESSRPDLSVGCQLVSDLPFIKWAEITHYSPGKKERGLTPWMIKNKLFRFRNWARVRRSRPVSLSGTAPVACW